MVGDWGDPRTETKAHLQEALEHADDPEVRFHIRQAMQILHDRKGSRADA